MTLPRHPGRGGGRRGLAAEAGCVILDFFMDVNRRLDWHQLDVHSHLSGTHMHT